MEDNDIRELTRAIKRQNRLLAIDQSILRGCILGIFYALGTTVGFAVTIVFLAYIINIGGGIPIISNILEETGLAKIIQYQLDEIEKKTGNKESDTDNNKSGNKDNNDNNVQYIVETTPTPSVKP